MNGIRIDDELINHRGISNPTVSNCSISGCKWNGIRIKGEHSGAYEDCEIFSNAQSGFAVTDNGNPTVKNCLIYNNLDLQQSRVGVRCFTFLDSVSS